MKPADFYGLAVSPGIAVMMFLSGTLAFLLGALGGLAPTALFTTFRKKPSGPPAGDGEDTPSEP